MLDSTRTQSFGYDALNRLLSAGDNGHWANTYVYDAWGNLTNKNVGNPAGENLQKAADANNHLSGMSYDAGGNVTNDGLSHTFTYDSENRITVGAGVTNTYDADGRRITTSNGPNYWYGPAGGPTAETDSAGNWTNYIFFGGQRIARNQSGDIKFYITDHLHSTALFVDKAGTAAAILDDNDMYPWGGVVPGVGKTTSSNTIKFTGQYRDGESQLDYFGARYYGNLNGRFMSPDWDARPATVPYADFGNPQSLNLYSYVGNSPLTETDFSGHMAVMFTGAGIGYVGGYGVNDGSGGLPDPFRVEWIRATINTTITFGNGTSKTFDRQGDVALSGTGEWLNQTNYTPAPMCTCTLQVISRPLQKVENSNAPTLVKWFVGIFARHLLLLVTESDGSQTLIEGWKFGDQLGVKKVTDSDEIKKEIGPRSTKVGKPTQNLDFKALMKATEQFQQVRYHAVFGPNSNSAAHWFLEQARVPGIFEPFGTPAWRHSVY